MKRMIWVLVILMGMVISGCTTEPGGAGGYERPSGHQGHHY